jgi:hypothetical protein
MPGAALSDIDALWVAAHPAAAFTAGLYVASDQAALMTPSEQASLLDALRDAAQAPGRDELATVALRAIQTELACSGDKVVHATRETVDWTRAIAARPPADSEVLAGFERQLAGRVDAIAPAVSAAVPLERMLAAIDLTAVHVLSDSAGLDYLRDTVDDMLGDLPEAQAVADGALETVLARLQPADPLGIIAPADHARLVRDACGFAESAEALESLADQGLREELEITSQVARQVDRLLGMQSVGLEESYARLSELRTVRSRTTLEEAVRQTKIALDLFGEQIVELNDAQRSVMPEAAPPALVPLITEGEEFMLDSLTANPRALCYVSTAECGSAYTLANVVYHELAHCWHMLAAATAPRQLPAAFRVSGMPGRAMLEGVAMRREWEVFDLYRSCIGEHPAHPYAGLFDGLGIGREQAVLEFELETRYWRVARWLRALFDIRVHAFGQPYAEFVRESAAITGFDAERVHKFCFAFFWNPGEALCYSLGAAQLDSLAVELMPNGLDRRQFNSAICQLGLLPPVLWRDALSAALRPHRSPPVGGR